MEENRKDMLSEQERKAQPSRDEKQNTPVQEDVAKEDEKQKRPRNIVTDFYDSINVSVRQLDIALVVLCVFILVVIIVSAKLGV